MSILKNALIPIARNKGRNILIGIIILVIACASTVTLAINNTASDLIGSYQSAYDKELTISFNRENMTRDIDSSKREKLSDAKENMKLGCCALLALASPNSPCNSSPSY